MLITNLFSVTGTVHLHDWRDPSRTICSGYSSTQTSPLGM